MGISFANILIILFIVLIVFGAGKLPKVMGDLGKGLKNFKDALKDENASSISEDTNLIEQDKKEIDKKNDK